MRSEAVGRWTILLGGVTLLLIGITYLATKSLFSHEIESDFRFIWMAGHIWAMGGDPYGPAYARLSPALFPEGPRVEYWLYPPNWWPIARPLAALPFGQALALWRDLNALLLLVGSAFLLEAATRNLDTMVRWGVVSATIGLTCFVASTPQTLAMGQTSILIWFGLCLLGRGLLIDSVALVIAGTVLVLLKPHMGAVAIAALLIAPRWRLAAVLALVISALLALPQLLAFGPLASARGFLANIGHHAGIITNVPLGTTGLGHLLFSATGLDLSATASTGLAMIVAAAASWWVVRDRPGDGAAVFALIVGVGCFMLELHAYDMIWLAALLPCVLLSGRASLLFVLAALLLALRPAPLEAALFGPPANQLFAGALVLSLAALLGLVGVALSLARAPAARDRRAA